MKRPVYHIASWLLLSVFLFFSLQRNSDLTSWQVFQMVLSIELPLLFLVYSHFWIRDQYFKKRKYIQYLLGTLVVIGSSLLLDWMLAQVIYSTSETILQTLINYCSLLLLSTGLQYFKRGIINQYQNQELRARNAEAELKMLKAQLNPHFMFNTLNNIYAVNELDSQKGSEMILELSDVMRYHLEGTKLQFVSLNQEVQLLNSYINLEKLRLNDTTTLEIDIDNIDTRLKISPVILLPFVENAFKYGAHPTQKSTISMSLETKGNEIIFSLKNDIINNKKVVKSHIGLENTKRRLQLIYPDKHDLTISTDTQTYHVLLKIDV